MAAEVTTTVRLQQPLGVEQPAQVGLAVGDLVGGSVSAWLSTTVVTAACPASGTR